jgi:hypothetical protein
MNSSVSKSFRSNFDFLPESVRELAAKNYLLWCGNPSHPSLQFKKIGPYWSIRVGLQYPALGREKEGRIYWFWIGHHKVYDRLISHL